jgi:hypothetical protein
LIKNIQVCKKGEVRLNVFDLKKEKSSIYIARSHEARQLSEYHEAKIKTENRQTDRDEIDRDKRGMEVPG